MILPKSNKDYFFVGVQLLLFAVYFLPIEITSINLPGYIRYSGLVLLGLGSILGAIALLQINTKLSPFPTPVINGKLITNGAFAISRHPIYSAILLMSFGYGVFQASIFKMVVFILLFVLFYFKSKYEEQLLSAKFQEYNLYKKSVGKFFPKLNF